MADDRTIFDEPHYQSLEFIAAKSLGEGNAAAAFKFADRRCRIRPSPEPHCYVLRAEASFQMGAKDAAIADLAKALEIAPDNVAANRRMLAWTDGSQQIQAAIALVGQERQFDALRKAIKVLHRDGLRRFANVVVFDEVMEGWAVWDDEAPLEVSITNGIDTTTALFESDVFHPLAEYGHATSFRMQRPRSVAPQTISLSISGKAFHSIRTAGNDHTVTMRVHRPRSATARNHPVTVIVPVYADYDATRLCLETLLAELKVSGHRALIVDDATPDTRIAKYIADLVKKSRVDVIVNKRNLGFVGTINRALEHVTQGDVILLNSDTIVPPQFIDRLAAAARSSSDIGTVTPLSNHGEFTSFPIPNQENPLASAAEIQRIDAIAAKANSTEVIDIPSGIGFCLYITRACLDRTGPLSEDFGRGYLEDADFCLRARERGFRNVCAPSVYIGHAGSKSFGQEKRSLVVHNLGVLERRFPKHRLECGAFMAADPLRTAREAIERKAAVISRGARLLVSGAGVVGAIARERARAIGSKAQSVIILEIRYRADGVKAALLDAANNMPQSIEFNLSESRECDALTKFLKAIRPSEIEILDPANVPLHLVDLLLALKIPYDIFIADMGLLGPHDSGDLAAAPHFLPANKTVREFNGPRNAAAHHGTEPDGRDWNKRWRQVAEGAQRILAPCSQAEAFAASLLPQRRIEKIVSSATPRGQAARKKRKSRTGHLGFVPVRSCADEQWLMSEVTGRLGRVRPHMSFSVVGAALDDIALMRRSQAFVTGAVEVEEFDHLVGALGIDYLFVSTTRPLFGHPLLSVAHSSSLPVAYFDWSNGQIKHDKRDLAIDPRLPIETIVGALNDWMTEP